MAWPGRCSAGIFGEVATRSVSQPTTGAVRNDRIVAKSIMAVMPRMKRSSTISVTTNSTATLHQ